MLDIEVSISEGEKKGNVEKTHHNIDERGTAHSMQEREIAEHAAVTASTNWETLTIDIRYNTSNLLYCNSESEFWARSAAVEIMCNNRAKMSEKGKDEKKQIEWRWSGETSGKNEQKLLRSFPRDKE